MKLRLLLVALSLTATVALKLQAQNFPGYRSGNYTGVNGVFVNPASIADNRYRWDFNLFSFNGFIGNDKAYFNFKDITTSKSDNFKNRFLGGNGNTNANVNVEVLGPSAMFNLTKKSAMAITTRARVVANVKDFDGNLINSVINNGNNNYPYSVNSTGNSYIITNGWAEIGISYAREIASSGPNYLKAGVTLKYLSGAGNNYLQLNQVKATIDADAITQNSYLKNTTGTVAIGNSGEVLNQFTLDKFFGNGNHALGGDIGVVYEYRPNYADAAHDSYNRNINKYKFKVGLSLLDIGKIKYTSNANSSAGYNVHIGATDKFYLAQLNGKNLAEIKSVLDANTAFFTPLANGVNNSYNASLPTVLQADIDYHLHRGFFVSLGGQLNIVSKSSLYSANQYNSVTITPRYEGKAFGVYFPINYNELTHFNAGISLRGGPLFIGSGSLFTAIAKSKQADFHIGLHIGILQKRKKEKPLEVIAPVAVVKLDRDGDGIYDADDKCPDVAGLAKYHGCPIPDTDGDGMNDEADKCPTIAGIAKYNGCPIPDTDGDGINDDADKCPTVAGTAKYNGCPIPDTDVDGVNDEEDKCPTIAGPASNYGCPVIEKAVKDKINFAAKNIFFATGSTKLLPKSYKSLDGVATLLKADPMLKMDIDGYTDNTGKPEKNLMLSQQRAQTVKVYLVSKGVPDASLLSTGYGIEKPVAENKTAIGRVKNRRVELTVRNY